MHASKNDRYLLVPKRAPDHTPYCRVKTRTISDNGFTPIWDERFEFKVSFPEMACLCLVVYDEDTFGDAVVVGQSVIPLGSKEEPTIRSGWRSVQLYDTYNHEMPLTSVLIHVTKKFQPRGNVVPLRQHRLSAQLPASEAKPSASDVPTETPAVTSTPLGI